MAFFSKAYKEPAWQWREPGTDHDVSAGALSNRRPKQKPGSMFEAAAAVGAARHGVARSKFSAVDSIDSI